MKRLREAVCVVAVAMITYNAGAQPDSRDADRAQAERFEARANDLYKLENQNPKDVALHMRRMKAFSDAAQLMSAYTQKYAPSGSLEELLLKYRVAQDFELSGKFYMAYQYYDDCQKHLQYHRADAKYLGTRIDVLVPERMKTVLSRTGYGSTEPFAREVEVDHH